MKKSADHFHRIGLVVNAEKSACAPIVRTAARLIQRSGRTVVCDGITAGLAKLKCATTPDVTALAREVDLLLVFGGDGTMLHTARQIAGSDTPMLG
ncbi:MAG TPA: NAD(+)/NADH kinase, partial [Verrucomicrobiae bacterium]|nr:NAD(+)/NADH kinase [Verrucomicrobiae bacterium]